MEINEVTKRVTAASRELSFVSYKAQHSENQICLTVIKQSGSAWERLEILQELPSVLCITLMFIIVVFIYCFVQLN